MPCRKTVILQKAEVLAPSPLLVRIQPQLLDNAFCCGINLYQAPVVLRVENAIHKIKLYLVDSAVFIHPLNNWALVVRSTFFYHTRWMVIYSLYSMMRLLFNWALIKKSGKVISERSYSCGFSCLSVLLQLKVMSYLEIKSKTIKSISFLLKNGRFDLKMRRPFASCTILMNKTLSVKIRNSG